MSETWNWKTQAVEGEPDHPPVPIEDVDEANQGVRFTAFLYGRWIEVRLLGRDNNLDALCEAFKRFLAAAGFSINPGDEVMVIGEDEDVVRRGSDHT